MRFFARIISSKIAGIALSLLIIGLLFQQVSAYPADQDTSIYIPESVGFNNAVYYIAPQNDGKIILGGLFTGYNGVAANRIIRLHSDGTRDASFVIGSGFNDQIRAIAIQNDGKIIVGGFFTNYNGVVANRIIRLHSDGTRDTSFAIGSGFNAQVRAIAIQNDGKIILGGAITNYNGTTAHRIIRLNSDGTRDTSFDVGTGRNNNVRSIAIQSDGKIILGGGFTISSGVTTNRIVRLYSNGTRDYSFTIGSGFTEQINYIYMTEDEKFFVGGLFTGYNGVAANSIIKLNNDGTIDTSFDVGDGFNNDVRNINIQSDGKILVGGLFTGYNGVAANNIIKLNSDGTIDTSFDVGDGFDAAIHALTIQKDDKIIVGGDFTTYKSASGAYLARLHGNSLISLLDTRDTNKIHTEFTSKGYILSGSVLSGSAPMVFIDTLGRVPIQLTIKNDDTILTLPQNIEIKNKSDGTDYTGRFFPPTSITPSNQPTNTISAISIGATDRSLQLTNGLATLSIPAPGKHIGDFIQVHYSEDNGTTWHPQSITNVVDIGGQTYVQVTTDHFTDFAITDFTGSFVINNDASSTTSNTVTLNNSTTPTAIKMRFANTLGDLATATRENYATTKSRTLPGAYGTKVVYAQFDADGNGTSDVETSDEILYTGAEVGSCPAGSYCGDLKLRIITGHSYCQYGTTLDFGTTGLSYSGRSLITGFVTTGGDSQRFCEDKQGLGTWALTIQSSDLVNTSTNVAAQTIPASRVFIKNPAAYIPQGEGVCTFSSGDSLNQRINLSGAKEILGKVGAVGEGCKIMTDNLSLKVDLIAAQAIGQYSGTLTINVPNF